MKTFENIKTGDKIYSIEFDAELCSVYIDRYVVEEIDVFEGLQTTWIKAYSDISGIIKFHARNDEIEKKMLNNEHITCMFADKDKFIKIMKCVDAGTRNFRKLTDQILELDKEGKIDEWFDKGDD